MTGLFSRLPPQQLSRLVKQHDRRRRTFLGDAVFVHMRTHRRCTADNGALLPRRIIEHETWSVIAHGKVHAGLSRRVEHHEENGSSTVRHKRGPLLSPLIDKYEMLRTDFGLDWSLLCRGGQRLLALGEGASGQPERGQFGLKLSHRGAGRYQKTQQDGRTLHPPEPLFQFLKSCCKQFHGHFSPLEGIST